MLVNKDRVRSQEEQLKQFIKTKKMSPERLRAFRGFEKTSDKDAEKFISEMEEFCKIVQNHMYRTKK